MFMEYIILAFATWRISSLLKREAGPWDIFDKVRNFLGVKYDEHSEPYGTSMLSKMVLCVWCNSVWVGGMWAILYLISPLFVWLALPFALSAGAILIECVVGEAYDHR